MALLFLCNTRCKHGKPVSPVSVYFIRNPLEGVLLQGTLNNNASRICI